MGGPPLHPPNCHSGVDSRRSACAKVSTPLGVKLSRTSLPEKQHKEMEWEEQEEVMSDMEVDPHDKLKMEKSMYRAIRLRRRKTV